MSVHTHAAVQSTEASIDCAVMPTAAAPKGIGPVSGLREFFRHHGLLAPAVRLLRRLPILGKVAVVAAGFVAAAVLLGAAYTEQVMLDAADIREDRLGAQHLSSVGKLRDGVLLQREAEALRLATATSAASSPPAQSLQPLAWAELQALHAGAPLADAEVWKRLQTQWQEATDLTGADAQSRWRSLVRLNGVIAQYRLEVVLASGLDRNLHLPTHQLAKAAAVGVPTLVDRLADAADLALLSGLGNAGNAPTLDAVRHAADAQALARDAYLSLSRDMVGLQTMGEWPKLGAASERALATAAALLAVTDGALAIEPRPTASQIDIAARAALVELGRFEAELLAFLDGLLAQRQSEARAQMLSLAAAVGLLLASGLYLLVGFHRVMAGGLRMLSSEVRRMAQGDLSARPTPRGHDEVAHALQSLSGSLAMLSDMFSTVRQGVTAVVQASGQIARGNGDLAERTTRSMEQLQGVVASVNLYMEQLDQSARRVNEAASMVEVMRLEAARSRHNMGQLQSRMKDLQARSQEIGAIVELIDGIAFRTNVLALNASIEAAKAGETGRGFAVVAQEVRRLARRSAESARSIQDIVARSAEDIVEGAALADRTGDALRATDLHVARVHESMQQIVQLTRGGEENSRSILSSIHALDQLTGDNGNLVEQIASASVALSESGDELSRRVSDFKLG